jgi:hypothetical protein
MCKLHIVSLPHIAFMLFVNIQFGCPAVDPIIASPYAVDNTPKATNITNSALAVLKWRCDRANIVEHFRLDLL